MPGHVTRSRGKHKQCAYCERVFTKEEHLKRHERAHTGERPFKCHKCGRSYARSDVLFRHSQTHCSTSDKEKNKHGAIRPSSIITVVDDDDAPSGDNQGPSHSLSRRQPSASLISTISGAHECIPKASSQHTSSDSSSAARIPSIEARTNDTACVGLERHKFRRHGVSKHSRNCTAQDCHQRNDPFLGCIRQEESHESDSPPPQKKQRFTTECQQIVDTNQGSTTDQPAFAISETFQSQLHVDVPSTFQGQDTRQQCSFGSVHELDMLSFDTGQTPIPSDTHFNFDVMECLSFDSLSLPVSISTVDAELAHNIPRSSRLMTISAGQMQRVQRMWSRQRPKLPAQIRSRLWNEVIEHNADNIFSIPQHSLRVGSFHSLGCNMDQECRTRLMRYCKDLDISYGSSSTSTDDMPMLAMDTLDSSLDFYFQLFHPVLPVIHKSTFDARNTPSPLLLAMCLVGLSYLDRIQTKAFLIKYLRMLLPACIGDLTSRTLSGCTPSDILTTLGTVLIVAYLALGFRDEIDIYQAYMLCTQTLRVADKQGLFAAGDGDDLFVNLSRGESDPDGFWKAWGRVESIKRLICCLIYLDMAYARLMSTSGVIDIDKVEIYLPCDDSLFEDATTAAAFLLFIQQGVQIKMPRMNVRNLHKGPTSRLNQNSTQILLRSLYLRVIAANSRLSNKDSLNSDSEPASPVERLAVDECSKDIIADVVLMSKTHANFLSGRHRNNELGWHYLCILLTADIDLLETACGRDGLEAAEASLIQVFRWSQSSSARRALLHAAQVFNILNLCRIRESYLTRPDLVLFVSALVISQYFLVTSHVDIGFDRPAFELLQDIDWTSVGDRGFGRATGCVSYSVTPVLERGTVTSVSVGDFLESGGPVLFAGEAQGLGGMSAKKIARKFAHLMDGFGRWDGCSYSQLLRTMCGFTHDFE